MRTLHGMHVHGFPNAFILQAAHGANLISNYPHNLSEGGRTIAAIVRHATDHGITAVEATAEAEDEWMEMLLGEGRVFGAGFLADCTPGYYNNEGRPATPGSGLIAAIGYPEGPVAFFAFMDKWRTDGQFEGLSLDLNSRRNARLERHPAGSRVSGRRRSRGRSARCRPRPRR